MQCLSISNINSHATCLQIVKRKLLILYGHLSTHDSWYLRLQTQRWLRCNTRCFDSDVWHEWTEGVQMFKILFMVRSRRCSGMSTPAFSFSGACLQNDGYSIKPGSKQFCFFDSWCHNSEDECDIDGCFTPQNLSTGKMLMRMPSNHLTSCLRLHP